MATSIDPNANPDAYTDDRLASFLEAADELPAGPEDEAPTEAEAPAEEPVAEEPDAPAAEAPAEEAEEVDPLADATPFTYTVDGQDKTFDGIRVLADAEGKPLGGIIPAEAMQQVRDRLQRADFLEANDKARYEKMREYESVAVETPRGTLTGMDAVQHYAAEHAKLTAAVQLMASVLEDPEKLAALYGDPREIQLLARELGLTARDAEGKALQQFRSRTQDVRQQDAAQQDRQTVTTNSITQAVQHWASQFPSLTPDDTQRAVAYFGRLGSSIVRPATPDEAKAAGVKPGELVIDHPVIHEWLKDRAEMRQQASASTSAAAKAAKENAARLAASARPKAKAATPAAKTSQAAVDKLDEWQAQRLRMMGGTFSSDDE